jgi:hypothetical protein
MLDIIKIRIDTYASGLVKHFTAGEYDSVSVGSTGSYSENFSQNYALLPVWFLNVKYKGINYGIAVNGQTGKVCGELPVSRAKVAAMFAAIAAPLGVIAHLIFNLFFA